MDLANIIGTPIAADLANITGTLVVVSERIDASVSAPNTILLSKLLDKEYQQTEKAPTVFLHISHVTCPLHQKHHF